MLDKTCINFLEELASKAPVPGGGGASALVGAIGTALGSMVGNLTVGKKRYMDVEEDIKKLLERSERISVRLKELVAEDARVFGPLSEAYRMPSGTEDEKQKKEKAMQAVLVEASMVPLEIAEYCLAALILLEEYAEKGSRLAVSDAGVGALFCKAALQGAGLNVLINTGMMKDKKLKKDLENKLDEIETAGIARAEAVYEQVRSQIQK